jgi:hypothetical protein
MRVFLDDERMPDGVPGLPEPEAWVIVRSAIQCIALLETGEVVAVSLDHDLGADVPTGYDVACWLEMAHAEGRQVPAQLYVHTANPVGRGRMLAALRRLAVTVLTVG